MDILETSERNELVISITFVVAGPPTGWSCCCGWENTAGQSDPIFSLSTHKTVMFPIQQKYQLETTYRIQTPAKVTNPCQGW